MSLLLDKDRYTIWVLAPLFESEDENLSYYYDYSQSKAEYKRVFENLQLPWHWVDIRLATLEQTLDEIMAHQERKNILLNLCDGDEVNGVPGISVIHALNRRSLCYTGSDVFFYDITTSKIPMKQLFDATAVPTPPWIVLQEDTEPDWMQRIGTPLIVKPAVSAGSLGLSVQNVVQTETALKQVLNKMHEGYHGWKLDDSGILIERYIAGREFTTFLTGSAHQPEHIHFYTPVERVFHPSLPPEERFLSFDRLWETYEEESPMPGQGYFYEYAAVTDANLLAALEHISLHAYTALQGRGYTRMDFRQDEDGKLYVLEANAQCGLSEDEDYTSIGAILRVSGISFTAMIAEVLEDALRRHEAH